MSWYSVDEAARMRRCTIRQIYRLISRKKLQSQTTPEDVQVWLDEPSPGTPGMGGIELSLVSQSKITQALLYRVEGMLISISASERIIETESDVATRYGIPSATQRRYKNELRGLFKLTSRTPLSTIACHPQIKQALEYVLVPDKKSDRGNLRSARGLSVVMNDATGEVVRIEDFLKCLYPREGVNAASCYRSLKKRCLKKLVFKDGSPATIEDLPSKTSVVRYLKIWRRENLSVRRGRSRKHDWETGQEQYVTRDPSIYKPGELWIGDHTELDFMILNEQGKPDRRWVSAFMDMRTGLMVGYCLSWQPNSNTIASAFRAGVLGSQLMAHTEERGLVSVQITSVPEVVMMDNGKDYRSKYTQRVFGKIDFEDCARLSVQRITKLHYTQPYHGQSKAELERWFGTIQRMMKYLPGYKSNRYENKPDSLTVDIRQGNLLTTKEFDKLFAEAVNAYNNRIHSRLKNQTPIECYLTNQQSQRTIDVRVLDFLMMHTRDRVIRRGQITLLGVEYYSDQLVEHNGHRCDVYYDQSDLGFISVYAEGEFVCVATNKRMVGVDEQQWEKIVRDRKRTEKTLTAQLKDFRHQIDDDAARSILHEAEMNGDVKPVECDLIRQKPIIITHITGIEQQARVDNESRKEEAQVFELKERARKKAKTLFFTSKDVLDNVK